MNCPSTQEKMPAASLTRSIYPPFPESSAAAIQAMRMTLKYSSNLAAFALALMLHKMTNVRLSLK